LEIVSSRVFEGCHLGLFEIHRCSRLTKLKTFAASRDFIVVVDRQTAVFRWGNGHVEIGFFGAFSFLLYLPFFLFLDNQARQIRTPYVWSLFRETLEELV